jgi:hypothetical protein
MILGIDFDNTLVCYDGVFHKVALEMGWIPPETPANKNSVRQWLRDAGREDDWTWLQGHVYGARINEAAPYDGAAELIRECTSREIALYIVSHKTAKPLRGEPTDLHEAAHGWLRHWGFVDPSRGGLPPGNIFFELTREDKVARIARCGCTVFVDDLPEVFQMPAFPMNTRKILFDPAGPGAASQPFERARSWAEVGALILPN